MDGKHTGANLGDRPIAKPVFPLPSIFSRRRRSELPTLQRSNGEKIEQAHFYRKDTSSSGSPVYGFYITRENDEREIRGD